VSTAPAQPIVVVEADVADVVVDEAPDAPAEGEGAQIDDADEDVFVVDLGADVQTPDEIVNEAATNETRVQLGGANTLLNDRDTGVIIRRPATAEETLVETSDEAADLTGVALTDFASDVGEVGSRPLMSIILIDDGTMPAASAALAGLPFAVTIALDPARADAAELMEAYRADNFEVVIMAKLPEGALPSDVEVTFESLFASLPETIGVLDIGSGGLQTDRDVTEQAMGILASQGRGFVTTSQGLNMAVRAAEQAGVPSIVVYRDLDADNQDARVVRRFVDQAAFRARQESGVVLVGRMRPDTISALILWGSSNQDNQIAVVPVSAALMNQ
jgi:polysaccharide deacetylase 2 family uncharacterized protein YibQ